VGTQRKEGIQELDYEQARSPLDACADVQTPSQVQAQSWDVEGVTIVCDPEAPNPAGVVASRANAQYLANINTGEKPLNGPGPQNCGQVACNWGTSIVWCNEVLYSLLSFHSASLLRCAYPISMSRTPNRRNSIASPSSLRHSP
jgi:hypothetical protein